MIRHMQCLESSVIPIQVKCEEKFEKLQSAMKKKEEKKHEQNEEEKKQEKNEKEVEVKTGKKINAGSVVGEAINYIIIVQQVSSPKAAVPGTLRAHPRRQ